MKTLIFTTVALLSTFTLFADANDRAAAPVDPQAQFEFFFRKGQAKVFQGRAQALTMFNLDLRMWVHYKEPLPGQKAITFNLASDGNQHIVGVPVWPVSGRVSYEVADERGQLRVLKIDGESITLDRQPFTAYLWESEQGYQDRMERVRILSQKDARYEQVKGRLLGIVSFDMQKQNIRFYQVDDAGNMIQSGVFDGSAAIPKASYF